MKTATLVFLIAIGIVINGRAQLEYRSNGTLTFGNVEPYSYYTTHIEGWGHYFTYAASDCFLEICLGATAPRIAGAGNTIYFYNTETSTYNTLYAGTVYNLSDSNLKTNIVPIQSGLGEVMKLNPVSYNFKQLESTNGALKSLAAQKPKEQLGFLAQEVAKVVPQAVATDDKGRELLNYNSIIPLLTKSVQELSAEVDSLRSQVAELKRKMAGNAATSSIDLAASGTGK